MNNEGLLLWDKFLDYLYRTGDISVPTDFRNRCVEVTKMLDNDISGIVGTIINYSINAASEAQLKIECSEETLENLLDIWLNMINIYVDGIPTGLSELAKEYYKERWAGSSLCLMRVRKWEKITVGNVSIKVPTVLWFANGTSIYIKRGNETNYKLGSDKYFLDKEMKKYPLPGRKDENIIIQKPFARWFSKYPSPYLIKTGVYKNWKAMEMLQHKGDEVVSKVLPYLFLIEKGSENLFIQKDVDYKDAELKEMNEKFKEAVQKYESEKGKIPSAAVPFDQKYKHLIPDMRNILAEELYRQGYRALLAGLGFIDLLEITPSRQESRINPKPFITEVNAGVEGFKSMLMDVIRLIISENKLDHRKLFSNKNNLKIVNSPLKINVQQILDQLRSSFVYGATTIQTYHEVLGIDHEQEIERMKKEQKDGLRELFYPHLIQNREDIPDSGVIPITKKQNEKNKEKEKQPEHMQEAKNLELEIAPYDKDNPPDFLKKYPKGAQDVFITVFNKSLPKGEDYAFPVAWTALKRWLKKHGYVKKDDKWVKKSDLEQEELMAKKHKLLDKLLGDKKDENI